MPSKQATISSLSARRSEKTSTVPSMDALRTPRNNAETFDNVAKRKIQGRSREQLSKHLVKQLKNKHPRPNNAKMCSAE